MAKASIRVAYIGGIALIITSIITGLFTCNSSHNSPESQVRGNSLNNSTKNTASRDNNLAGRDLIQTTIYGDTKNVAKKINQSSQQTILKDERVISYNQQGGITAHTVIVSEDSELNNIPEKDNQEVQITKEGNKFNFIVKPKQGQWDSAFIAFPLIEESVVNAKFSNTLNKILIGFASGTIDYDFNDGNGNVTFKLFICHGQPSTRKLGYKLECEKLPSKIVFGDYGKRNKTFAVTPIEKP